MGSKLESAILEGPEALNKYISSGDLEELHDVMPFEDDSSPQQSPSPKRSRFDKDHNAQLIYEREEPPKQPAIPSLLSLDLSAPFTPVNLGDSGFRNFNDREDRFGDSGSGASPWANSNGPFQANTRTGGSSSNPWEIPSLLDGTVFRDRDNGGGFNNRDRDRDQGRNERGSRGKFNNFGNSNPDNRRSREGRQSSRGNRWSGGGSGSGSSGNRRN